MLFDRKRKTRIVSHKFGISARFTIYNFLPGTQLASVAPVARIASNTFTESQSSNTVMSTYIRSNNGIRAALLDALTKSLLVSVDDALEARVIALNASTGTVITAVWLKRSPGSVGEPSKVESHALQPGSQPDSNLPWFENAGSSAGLRFAAVRLFAYSRDYTRLQTFQKSLICQ